MSSTAVRYSRRAARRRSGRGPKHLSGPAGGDLREPEHRQEEVERGREHRGPDGAPGSQQNHDEDDREQRELVS